MFTATPVQQLRATDFGLRGLEVLFDSGYAARLEKLFRDGRGSGHSAGVGRLIAAAKGRFPHIEPI